MIYKEGPQLQRVERGIEWMNRNKAFSGRLEVSLYNDISIPFLLLEKETNLKIKKKKQHREF